MKNKGIEGINYSKYIKFALKFIFTGGAVLWLFSSVQWNLMFEELVNVNWIILICAFHVFMLRFAPQALRWRQLASTCGYPITLYESIRGYVIASFFNVVLPTGQGGDIVRGLQLAKIHNYSKAGILGTVFLERLIGLFVTLFLAISAGLIAVSKFSEMKNILVSILFLIVVLSILMFAFSNRHVRNILKKMLMRLKIKKLQSIAKDVLNVMDTSRANMPVMTSAVILTILNQLIMITTAFLIGAAIPGFSAPWYSYAVVVTLTFITVLLPSIGGYGIREAGYVIFFGWFGVTQESAAVFGILQLLFLLISAIFGAVFFILQGNVTQSTRLVQPSNPEHV